MSTDGKKPAPNSVFANALASRMKYEDKSVSAGMHNTIICGHCGAAREHGAGGKVEEALVCRYCKTPFGGATR